VERTVVNVVGVWQWTVENAKIVEIRLNLEVQVVKNKSVS
jgi:hypothetical protein